MTRDQFKKTVTTAILNAQGKVFLKYNTDASFAVSLPHVKEHGASRVEPSEKRAEEFTDTWYSENLIYVK